MLKIELVQRPLGCTVCQSRVRPSERRMQSIFMAMFRLLTENFAQTLHTILPTI